MTNQITIFNVVRWALLLGAAGATLFYGGLSSAPLPYHPWVDAYYDLLLHAGAFATLAVLLMVDSQRKPAWIILMICAVLAIELRQYFMPARTPSLQDVFAGFVGIGMGSLAGWVLEKLGVFRKLSGRKNES